ncbi:TPA: hypothetical protein WHR49_000051 [Neisseria meningitidis]|nr:hypothetical protein [Neisseria meningitidis]MBG8595126.1 hypothetical protein [Neisseria meningitidis]MBG8637153.1 hypothetical protein [Neisseria meningitidis]MBG8654869.1 hypothetical protein [Neisseria meningitidis]MBG8657207.1 hypothetical protein [Neisseria meningitidis]MBG8663602.1 hypothetical protein [Neisseria meningitidis]
MPSEALFALRTASPLRANGLNARNGFRPFFRPKPFYSGLTKIRTRRRSRRQYKQYGTDSLGASAP